MATLPQLEKALVNAHNAGDADAARKLAKVINQERQRRSADPNIEMVESIPIDNEGGVVLEQVPGTVAPEPEPTLIDKAKGVGETALTLGTGATTGLLGQIEGTVEGILKEIVSGDFGSYDAARRIQQLAMERAQQLTYSPETETGQEYVKETGEALAPLAAIPPLAEAQMLGSVASRTPVRAPVRQQAQKVQESVIDPAKQQVQQVAQEISKRVQERLPENLRRTEGTGESAGAAALDQGVVRQELANELPVPIKLTEGQKTRDFEAQRFERETAKMPQEGAPIRQRFMEQNEQLQQNLDAFIDSTGAQIMDRRGVGELVDDVLRQRQARDKAKVRALYKEAEKAGEMQEPINLESFVSELNSMSSAESTAPVISAAKKELVRLGGAVEGENGLLAIGGESPSSGILSLGETEQLRKFINKVTGNDPTNIKFAGDLKRALDSATESKGGEKYKLARKARAKMAKDYENVALVKQLLGTKRGSDDRAIALEDVVRKAVLDPSTSLDQMRHIRRLLQTKTGGKEGPGAQAWKELQGATLRHIQEQMTKNMQVDQAGNRVVSPAALDRVVKQLDQSGKLDFIFGKKGAEQLRTINEVAQTILTSPPGTVNHSNTATVIAGLMDVAVSGTAGMPVPIASGLRMLTSQIKDAKLKARIQKTLGE